MTVALAMPDDPRRDLVQRLVWILAAERRGKRRKRKADARLHADLDEARARFDRDVGIALDRWLSSRGFF